MPISQLNNASKSNILLLIALTVSVFTALWNSSGYPKISYDEGTYVGRAMHFIVTHTPQEDTFYDHPYFGQLFLAGLLSSVGYPESLHPSPEGNVVDSVEKLWHFPRLIIGILGVLDTFLIYKISERRYNVKVAFIASILFALMPVIWFLRTLFLESLLLPFLLSSILIALRLKDPAEHNVFKINASLTLLSGIFFGLSIFTKISVFIIIPLFVFLVLKTTNKKWEFVGLWLIPVIMIPLIWPGIALSRGELNYWWDGIYWQTHRQLNDINFITTSKQNTLLNALAENFLKMPILIVLGLAGLVIAAIRKDYFLILWIVPFLVFLYIIGFVRDFHLIPVLPAFSISGAVVIDLLSNKLPNKKLRQSLPFIIIFGISAFLLINIVMLVSSSNNDDIFTAAALVIWYLHDTDIHSVTMISNHVYSWIPKYVLHSGNEYLIPEMDVDENPQNDKVVMVADGPFIGVLEGNDAVGRHLVDVYNQHSKNGTVQIKIPQGNITLPEIWPSNFKHYSVINLIDSNHVWTPKSNTKLSQKEANFEMLLNSNETKKIFGGATMITTLKNTTGTPFLLYLEYQSNATNANTRYNIEIACNCYEDRKFFSNDLDNASGNTTRSIFLLPSDISEQELKLRLSVITDTPGDHFLILKKAAIISPELH